jgi:HK97 family phage prohead protease
MPVQAFSLEIKSLQENGTFQGLASVYGVTDLGGDSVQPGAFTKTLQASGYRRPLLWAHKDPIGSVSLRDGPTGLTADGSLTMAVAKAQEVYALLKDNVVRGLSIGYTTIKEQYIDGVNQLLELKLFEVSLCTFPMCEQAQVTFVKSQQQAEVLRWLRQLRGDVFTALERK